MPKRSAERIHPLLKIATRKDNPNCQICDYRNNNQYCTLLRNQVGKNTVCKGFQQQLQLDFFK
jgi:hypothetical protein